MCFISDCSTWAATQPAGLMYVPAMLRHVFPSSLPYGHATWQEARLLSLCGASRYHSAPHAVLDRSLCFSTGLPTLATRTMWFETSSTTSFESPSMIASAPAWASNGRQKFSAHVSMGCSDLFNRERDKCGIHRQRRNWESSTCIAIVTESVMQFRHRRSHVDS